MDVIDIAIAKSYVDSQNIKDNVLVNAANAKASEINAKKSQEVAASYAEISEIKANEASNSAEVSSENVCEAMAYANMSKSYAMGTGGDVRENDDIDCAKNYYEQTKKMTQAINGLVPMGTINFAGLDEPDNQKRGYFFNISDSFVSDERFKDGGGIFYGAGNNVIYTADGKWDVLAASLVSGVKGEAESDYRQGFINISPQNIGAVPASGGEFSGPIFLRQGSIVKKFGGIDGTHGYVKIAQLTVIAYYVNDPIIFEIGGRGWTYSRKLYVYFASGNTLDPGLGNFWIDNPAPYTVCIVKSAASTWDIYMQKSEAYGRCYICSLCNTYGGVVIDYPGTQVSSLPSDVIYPEIITWHYAHAIKDSADNRDITFSYSNAELTVEQAQHLAAWSRHELRAIGFPKVKTLIGLGNAENTADKDKYVKGVIDYGDTNRKIQIGYGGTGLTPDNASFIAAYTDNGQKIKDLSFANLKIKLALNNVNNTADSEKEVKYAISATKDSSGHNIAEYFGKMNFQTYNANATRHSQSLGNHAICGCKVEESGYYLAIGCIRSGSDDTNTVVNLYLTNANTISSGENYLAANGTNSLLKAVHLQVVGFFHANKGTYINLCMYSAHNIVIEQSDLSIILLRKD